MKRFVSLMLALAMLISVLPPMGAAAHTEETQPTEVTQSVVETEAAEPETTGTEATVPEDTEAAETTEATEATEATEIVETTEVTCEYEPVVKNTGAANTDAAKWDTDGDGVLEILAIGNSFSVDALEYFWQIADNLGIGETVIGNLYIGGCSLATHAANAKGDLGKYTYYHTDSGSWASEASTKISTALAERDWDYITLQQWSATSGIESSYNDDLTYLISYVRERSQAKLGWHMTWAYQQNTTHKEFPRYNSDQMTMYNAIVSAAKNKILPNEDMDFVIPSGTAVQNSRTSLLGDTTTRDGYHMTKDYGRYLTGLMWFRTLTGLSVDKITYAPAGVDSDEMAIAIESVNNAFEKPFEVTKSEFTNEIPEGYILLEPKLYKGAFWHSTYAEGYNVLHYDKSNSHQYFATPRFTKNELPVGSIIVVESGWQYRPEGWVTDALQTEREDVTANAFVKVTEEWWGDYTIRAFNISKVGLPSLENTEEAEVRAVFRIYVPENRHTHTYENGICTGCGEKEFSNSHQTENFRWEISNGKLTSITDANFSSNAATALGGSITNGVISSGRYQFAKPLSLLHDQPWAVEWRGSGDWTGMLLATTPDAYDAGLPYFFKTGTDSGLVAFGYKDTQVNNYGRSLKPLGLDYTQSHTYRLENRIHQDGSNMVYLLVDNVEIGPMNCFYIGGSNDQNQTVDWLSGKDFSISALGTTSHPINGIKLEYLQVMEGDHSHSYEAVATAPTCTEQGYTTYTCNCGASYVDDHVEAVWHSNENGNCSMCGCAMARITRDDITPSVGTVSSLDGTVNTTITTGWYWDIPIPEGAKQIRYMTFKTAASWGSAFLNGSTYISGVCETIEGYKWVTMDIPEGATIFRHGYLSDTRAEQNGRPQFQYVEFSNAKQDISQYMPRPATGCHSFSVNVNIAPAMGDPDGNIVGTDYGYIMLPTNYTSYGEPTRLIIVCHGAGGKRSTYQSNSWKIDQNTFWTDMGYAIMDMAACPKPLTSDDRAIHYGNPTVVDCYKAGFDYVMENFNLKQDGIYVIGTSMGGLSSFQIVQSGKFPVLAQVGFCPAIDLFKQAYCAKWGSAERDYQKSHISSYFGFEGAPASFTNTFPTDAEIELYKNNFEKTVKYSPILCNVVDGDITSIFNAIPTSATGIDATEAAIYAQLTATHPCPVMIIHSKDDSVVSYRYSQYFVDMLKRSGQAASLYTIDGVNHMAWQYGKNCTLQGLNGQITIKESQYEAYKFFEKFEKHEVHQPWVDPAVKATCSTTGLTEGKHCASCGEILVNQNVIPTTNEHTYENGICTGCGTEEIHIHSYETTITAPTCTEQGYTTYTCTACGENYVDSYVAAKGHAEVIDKAVAATCNTTGLAEGKHCSTCNTVLVAQKEIAALGHSFGIWTVTTKPTCTEKGVERRACDNCDHYETRDLAANGHTEVVDKAVAATCTTTGLTEGKHCSTCNTVLVAQKEIAALGHSYGAWTVTTKPTCTEKGQERRNCDKCDHYETRDLATDGHAEVVDKAVAATCTTTGLTEGKHCSVCSIVLIAQKEIPALGHSYGAWTVTTKSTCTEKGQERRNCNNCDHYETREVTANGHTEVIDKAVGATCTITGLTEGKHCSVCNTVLVPRKEIPAKGHTWDNGKVTKEPTEKVEGIKTYTCTTCGETKTEAIPTLDHTHKYTSKVTAPTCTAQGYTTYTCSCGDSYVDNYVQANGHSYGAWTVTTKPTCTEKGTERRACNNCDAFETREIAANGHTEATDKAVAAICTTTGLTEGKHCSVCNTVLVPRKEIPAKGHSWDAGKVTREPTEQTEGVKTYTCTACGETKTQSIPVLSHTHKYTSKVTAPTCTEQGYTTYTCTCGGSYVDNYVKATGHSYGAWTVTTKPTCTEKGSEHRDCSNCDHYEIREVAAKGHTEVIDKTVAATCTTTGLTEGKHCSVCNTVLAPQKEVPAKGHTWDNGKITKEPTEKVEGIKTFTCTACGETKTEVVPILDHTHKYTSKVTAPTCTAQGYTTYTCTCGDSYVDNYVKATGHSYSAWTVTTKPTCTEKGAERRECSNCDHYETREVAANGHTEVIDKAVAATCTTSGLTEGKHCSVCNTVLVAQTKIAALGHSWDVGVVTKEPTETEEGESVFTCQTCGETKIQKLPILSHVHKYIAVVTEPTCTEQGYTTYTCSCGDSYVDGYTEATGHEAGQWQANETDHWRVCAACSEILDMGVHDGANCTICGHEPPEQGHGYDLGDVNHDGKINAKDATLILQKSVGVLKETAKFCEDCAEVSGDGKLNAKDSTLILQFSVGLRDSFPARK